MLVVLPECFVSLYPSMLWAGGAITDPAGAEALWARFWDESVDVPGPLVDRLVEACARLGVHCAIGVNERESARPGGTVYNSLLLLGPEGLLHRHRKLMPTYHERLFHGFGDGRDLDVVETPLGRIGGLICWEHRMPLARYAVYRGAPQVWVAPTADTGDGWLALMRAVAIESGAFVVSVPQFTTRADFPADFPLALPDCDVFSPGGACIVDPSGEIVEGPLRDRAGILVVECDLAACAAEKQWFDVVGHYSREDVLLPLLTAQPPPGE